MTTDIRPRLAELLALARARQGDAILRNRDRLTLFLVGEAPELSDHVRALATALSSDAVWRLGAAPSVEALQPVVAEVAQRVNVQPAIAMDSVQVASWFAAGIGGAPAAVAPQPVQPALPPTRADQDWVGESVAVGAKAPPTGTGPAAQPGLLQQLGALGGAAKPGGFDVKALVQNKWFLAGIAGVAVLAYLNNDRGTPTPPAPPQQQQPQAPAGPGGGAPAPAGGGGAPRPGGAGGGVPPGTGAPVFLVLPQQGAQLPVLSTEMVQGNPVISFAMRTQGGGLQGSVMVSSMGWESGVIVGFAAMDVREPQSLSQVQIATLSRGQSVVARVVRPQWQFDLAGVRDICLAFEQAGAADVTLRGSALCVYSANCAQVIGCGRVP